MGKFEKNNPYARHGNGQLHAGKSGGEARGTERLVPGGRTRETIAAKEERAAALIDNLERLAFHAKTENTQVLASQAALDRLLGKPVQTQVRVDGGALDDWSDAELRHAADELRQRLAGADRSADSETGGGEPLN